MKTLLFIAIAFLATYAQANTQVFFKPDQAIILIQGKDSDAINLYNAMQALPKDESGTLNKTLEFNKTGEPYFSVACNYSPLASDASCTIKVTHEMAALDKEHKRILMGVNDFHEAPSVAKKFLHTGDAYQGEVFRSFNGQLRIWKTFDHEGNVVSFTLQYLG